MDQQKFEALKKIQRFRDEGISADYEGLASEGFDKSLLNVMIQEKLIHFMGVFSLTKDGEKTLADGLIIEQSLRKSKNLIILDSNAYDEIANGQLSVNLIASKKLEFEFYITHIQIDEINKCPDQDKRAILLLFMVKLSPIVVPTNSFILGISRLGEARLGDAKILEEIRKENLKHTEDALIGEVAIKNGYTLVTGDLRLKNKVNYLGGKAITIADFQLMLK